MLKKKLKKIGLPPGSLIHVGEKKTERVKITLIDYDENNFQEKEANTIEECIPFRDKPSITWINVDGLHQVNLLEQLGKGFGLHPLIVEDILSTGQRPKMEDFENHIFIVFRSFSPSIDDNGINSEQISMVVGINFVITFLEEPSDIFKGIRERIKSGKGRIRKMGSDYLAYSVLDAVVDRYFSALEKINLKIETLEKIFISKTSTSSLQKAQKLKKDILFLRQSVWPLRDVINSLLRGDQGLIRESTEIYLRDVYDHITQVIDIMEAFRDSLSSIFELYLTNTSNRMNAIMKVLTIISTIFMPLNLIAGIYGMNFAYMPELNYRWGYPLVVAVMSAIGVSMILYFKKKTWL